MLNGLDLFSGIGGLAIALSPWVRPIAYCEIDPYAQSVLLSRMLDNAIARAPIWDDVRTLRSAEIQTLPVDIVYGGFPCQDISVAGLGKGLAGERSGLFFEILRLACELNPQFLFLENVPGLRTRGAAAVCTELAAAGYDARWEVVSAQEVGAPHLRKRWFLVAANSERLQLWDEFGWGSGPHRDGQAVPRNNGPKRPLADGDGEGLEVERIELAWKKREAFERSDWWATEPDVGRVAHGVPARVDRIKALGNAVVPLQAREAFKRLMGLV